jgi:hypothetical protein
MIINSGMRTDIPAYFSEWFYNRIRDGYVLVRNPYYPEQVTRYQLDPDVVDCLSFCTKNPEPMLKRLDELAAFHQFWFVTITPYGKEIEPFVPDKQRVMDAFRQLSKCVGIQSVSWRYDPIFLTEKYDLDFHIRSFEKMAGYLSGYTDQCVISFIDLYIKTKRNFPQAREVLPEERAVIGRVFSEIGERYGIQIRSCCEGNDLAKFGIDVSGCASKQVMERAVGMKLDVPKHKKSQRTACECLLGNDIGMYHTCAHGCIYCYANYDAQTVRENIRYHDPALPFLIGGFRENDKIKAAKQQSYINGQMSLFDYFG